MDASANFWLLVFLVFHTPAESSIQCISHARILSAKRQRGFLVPSPSAGGGIHLGGMILSIQLNLVHDPFTLDTCSKKHVI
jgi:hypothetical protein